jgi:hypothetical protein
MLGIFWFYRHRRAPWSRTNIVQDKPTEATQMAPGSFAIEPFNYTPPASTQHTDSSATRSCSAPKQAGLTLPVAMRSEEGSTSMVQGHNLEQLLRLEAVGRLLEQRVADVLARVQPAPADGAAQNELPPEYAEQ